ncbi:MAG: MBL fold metallo-hydrolase RNA specificity domain-containing protein [Planctomycetota bacterium]|jgi:metallo-beta-lactamase family protein
MTVKIHFFGAAQNVTGSRYLVEARGKRILVDIGMYQERELRSRNWDPFPVPPESIDAIVLTHAHLDHSGFLPRLTSQGFQGPVHCTPATAEIAAIILLDSGKIQEEDAERKLRRHKRQKRKGPYPVVPLYTVAEAEKSLKHFTPTEYGEPVILGEGLEVSFHDAGHILGSSMVTLRVRENGGVKTLLFSGDVGRWDKPILQDPSVFNEADEVVMESTYGDRLHKDEGDLSDRIADIVNTTFDAGGNLIIPSFAVERAHELLYTLNELHHGKRIPALRVFLDSPMAIRVTGVFESHPELWDEAMTSFVESDHSPFRFPGFKMTSHVDDSKAINRIKKGAVIIAGSGMCTGGRIKHHLVNNIHRPECTVLFIGFQAHGTLGRIIVKGTESVRILGQYYPVRARIAQIHGFSGHADRGELFQWISNLETPPKRVFVTHGEEDAARSFATLLREQLGWEVIVPGYGDASVLD